MRCRACDYELWHCTGRVCPECAHAFSLKDFEFEIDSVLFHCPHCNHGIEGEGTSGWPDLNIEQCEGCGLATGLDYYIVRPQGDAESQGALLPIHSNEGNWFSRYFRTVWLVMTKPSKTMGRIPLHESAGRAWWFLLTTLLFTFAVTLIPALFLFAFPLLSYRTPQGGSGVSEILLIISIQAFLVFVLLQLYVVAWAGITHVLLLMTGGCSFTFNRTLQAIMYSGGASIVTIVPCLGGIGGTVWWNVSAINMISKGQRVSGGRASFAVLFAPLVLTFCICGGFIFLLQGAI
ncbi:MAG: YIP1 family protein [Planctomycetes bacterium]|nr:YIP1 family protein [Planctomycetota bacterium]